MDNCIHRNLSATCGCNMTGVLIVIFSLVCKRKFLYGKIPYACSVKLTDLILECQDHFYILNKKAGCVVTLLAENRLPI